MSEPNSTTMKVKVVLGNDTRRWRYTKQSTLSSLNKFITSSFELNSFWLQYEDDEGDRLTLSTQNDFEDAFDCAQNEERKSLKIYVIPGSIRNAQKRNNNSKPSDSSNNTCPPSPQSCIELKAAAIDFLQDPAIIKLLPNLHRRIFEEIKKCKTASDDNENKESDYKWDSPQNVEHIMRNILSTEEKFEPIISHELYNKKLQYCIPHFASKISMHLTLLMNFSCDAIAAWIPHITSVIGHGFSNWSNGPFDGIGFSDSMNTFFPLMCSFMSQHGDCKCDFDENGDTLHYGITCDGCNISPIKGARFKCCICTNYDLCSLCEGFGKHDNNHPMIKFNKPARNAVPPFMGLHEIMTQFGHGPHKWFGHHWKGRFGRNRNKNDNNQNQNNNNQQQQQQQQGHGNNTNVGFQPHHPHPPMPHGVPPHQWWNQDGDHHWGHRGHRAWKRYPHRYQHQQWQQQPYDTNNPNPWQQWCDNRNQTENNNDAASVVSSAISDKSSTNTTKKIKVMADFVSDVTLQDRTYYPIDTVLTKTWRMRNNGEYEWGNAVELVFFKGNESLTLEKRYPVINALPGQEIEVSAVIKTPMKPGRYCSYYRLQRNGEYFGPRVWVDIFAVDEKNPQNIQQLNMKNNNNNKKNKCKKGGKNKIIKLEKKEAKLEAKQLKLEAKSSKIESELKNVNKQLDLQNENENSQKLVNKQEKLKKQQNKLREKQNKLKNKQNELIVDEQQLLDDIANAAVKDLEKELDNVNISDIPLSAISCVCGVTLHKTSPIEAYRNSSAQVNCDICGKFCPSTSSIYHCPNVKSIAHPEGYDLCTSCVEYQMQGFIPNNNNNNEPININIAPPDVNLLPPPPVVVKPEIEDVFKYQQELEQLRAMNIANDKRIKQELIKEKGDVQRVANRLLQLQ